MNPFWMNGWMEWDGLDRWVDASFAVRLSSVQCRQASGRSPVEFEIPDSQSSRKKEGKEVEGRDFEWNFKEGSRSKR